MSKYRVLIRAFTLRRDVAPMALYQKILERMDCDVILAGARNFNLRPLRGERSKFCVRLI
jgi:hypothetical protein